MPIVIVIICLQPYFTKEGVVLSDLVNLTEEDIQLRYMFDATCCNLNQCPLQYIRDSFSLTLLLLIVFTLYIQYRLGARVAERSRIRFAQYPSSPVDAICSTLFSHSKVICIVRDS